VHFVTVKQSVLSPGQSAKFIYRKGREGRQESKRFDHCFSEGRAPGSGNERLEATNPGRQVQSDRRKEQIHTLLICDRLRLKVRDQRPNLTSRP
jgi:hypothetical protein